MGERAILGIKPVGNAPDYTKDYLASKLFKVLQESTRPLASRVSRFTLEVLLVKVMSPTLLTLLSQCRFVYCFSKRFI